VSLSVPDVELSSEGPIFRDIAGVDAEDCSHSYSGPWPHIPTVTTFDYAVRQVVGLSAEITAVTIRKGDSIETLLGGEYVV
jgi:hypothetical protein